MIGGLTGGVSGGVKGAATGALARGGDGGSPKAGRKCGQYLADVADVASDVRSAGQVISDPDTAIDNTKRFGRWVDDIR